MVSLIDDGETNEVEMLEEEKEAIAADLQTSIEQEQEEVKKFETSRAFTEEERRHPDFTKFFKRYFIPVDENELKWGL